MSNEEKKTETMERKIRQRIYATVEAEIGRLEEIAKIFEAKGSSKDYANTLEGIASIKSRCEMYCIQIEMAAQTAAMASAFNTAARKNAAPTPANDSEAPDNIEEIMRRASRPGVKSPQES